MFSSPVSYRLSLVRAASLTLMQKNGDTIPAKQTFTIALKTQGITLGKCSPPSCRPFLVRSCSGWQTANDDLPLEITTSLTTRLLHQRAEELLRRATAARWVRVSPLLIVNALSADRLSQANCRSRAHHGPENGVRRLDRCAQSTSLCLLQGTRQDGW